MKILFATKNPAKVDYYGKEVMRENPDIEIITIKDLGEEIEVEESGKTAIENAVIKAEAYYNFTNIPTIAIDDNLYIEELRQEEQPGTHVRRADGRRLSDSEMIEYYTKIVKDHGGKVHAKWVKGVAVCLGGQTKTFEYQRDSFYFVDTPSPVIHEGYPLDSISIIPKYNKYLSEMKEDELRSYKDKSNINGVVKFILENIS